MKKKMLRVLISLYNRNRKKIRICLFFCSVHDQLCKLLRWNRWQGGGKDSRVICAALRYSCRKRIRQMVKLYNCYRTYRVSCYHSTDEILFLGIMAIHGKQQLVAKQTLTSNRRVRGEILKNGKWEAENASFAFGDFLGIKNFATARLLTYSEMLSLSNASLEGLEVAPLYLEIRHSPALQSQNLKAQRDEQSRNRSIPEVAF